MKLTNFHNKYFSIYWALFSIFILFLGLIWIKESRLLPEQIKANQIAAPQTGFLAPDFTLPSSTGESITLSSFYGSPVIVNFWASWCTPCRKEMPAIQQVYADFENQGLIILGINTTSQDNKEDAIAFSKKVGVTFPILFDENGQVNTVYQIRALPTTFFINSDGVIQEITIGGPMSEALIRSKIETIMPKTKE